MPLSRHCERSEAIQLGGVKEEAGLLRRFAPRNDEKNQVFDSAFFEANVALRLSSSSTFTPFLRMM